MKCIDCGKDAVVLTNDNTVLSFPLCRDCCNKRLNHEKTGGVFGVPIYLDDLYNEISRKQK